MMKQLLTSDEDMAYFYEITDGHAEKVRVDRQKLMNLLIDHQKLLNGRHR